jgi:hypothetical protein
MEHHAKAIVASLLRIAAAAISLVQAATPPLHARHHRVPIAPPEEYTRMVCRRTSTLGVPAAPLGKGNHQQRPRGVPRQVHQQARWLFPPALHLQISRPRNNRALLIQDV